VADPRSILQVVFTRETLVYRPGVDATGGKKCVAGHLSPHFTHQATSFLPGREEINTAFRFA